MTWMHWSDVAEERAPSASVRRGLGGGRVQRSGQDGLVPQGGEDATNQLRLK